jgi:hypothetical protein
VNETKQMEKQSKLAAIVEGLESSKQGEVKGNTATGVKQRDMPLMCVMQLCIVTFVLLTIMFGQGVPNFGQLS